MIRLIQRKLIIPRGDTGSFSIPTVAAASQADVAVFTIFSHLTRTRVFQKTAVPQNGVLVIEFTHNDTVNLPPGRYSWDIKFYKNPVYADEELVNGDEIDSYYAGYSLPDCEIRETGDNLLVSSDAAQGALSPEQLDIISAALSDLAAAVQQTEINVSHYPQIRDEEWYVWNAEANDYVATGVSANGIVDNGIESAVVNNDYTLTLNFTDGTSYTSGSIRGAVGNGIEDVVLNNDYTLTITFTNGTSYTTPSIRGMVGATPQFSIGTVQEGASAAATITGTAEAPVLNLTLPNANVPTKVSELENDANYAVDANYVHTDNNYTTEEKTKLSGIAAGAEVNVNADWNATEGDAFIRNKPTSVSSFTNDAGYLTSFTETDPTVPEWAKAARKPTYTASEVGAPTVAEMNTAIGTAIGQINSFDLAVVQTLPTQNISTHTIYLVPKTGETNDVYDEYVYINSNWEMVGNTQIDLSDYALKSELPTKVSDLTDDSGHYIKPATGIPASDLADGVIPDAPVQDVQVNGVSVLSGGVANVPIASDVVAGAVKVKAVNGIRVNSSNELEVNYPSDTQIKNGSAYFRPLVPALQEKSAFYGLAKAAGADMKDIANTTVGTYPDAQKEAIQSMLGITQMLAPINPNLVATQAYAIGDVFAANGHLYKATAAIAQDEAIIPDTNCVETTMVDAGGKIKDVQVNGMSVVSDGVANVPKAASGSGQALGVVMANTSYGTNINSSGAVILTKATDADLKSGIGQYRPVTPSGQHVAIFYGLSKAAGVDLKDETVTLGTYPETAKAAIRSMIGAENGDDIVKVQDTEPTTAATKIWLPETSPASVEVPTVTEMNAALANKANLSDIPNVPVEDVQVNGTSVITNNIANIPIATQTTFGVTKGYGSSGINIDASGNVSLAVADASKVKAGTSNSSAIPPSMQHTATFYGLAKASGDTTQSASSNAVGTYTDNAKASIKAMLGIQDGSTSTVDVSGTTPIITAVENTRYVCGEVTSLSFTPPASGISIVRFTSGSSVTVLTIPSTVKFPEWFDPTSLETDTIYEICVTDGIYGAVMSWAL